MKILVAIESSENAKKLTRSTLKWAPRAGFNLRVFIPSGNQLQEYKDAIDHINYDQYMDLPSSVIEVGKTPEAYAKQEGFDLLVTLPDDLIAWNKTRNKDLMVLEYAADIGSGRLKLANAQAGDEVLYNNGARMKRL